MKNLILVVLFSAFAIPASSCEPTAKDAKRAVGKAVAYFFDQVAKDKNVSKSNPTFDIVDCHEYDGEFSQYDVEVSWVKKVDYDYQQCSVVVRAEPTTASVDGEPSCK